MDANRSIPISEPLHNPFCTNSIFLIQKSKIAQSIAELRIYLRVKLKTENFKEKELTFFKWYYLLKEFEIEILNNNKHLFLNEMYLHRIFDRNSNENVGQ